MLRGDSLFRRWRGVSWLGDKLPVGSGAASPFPVQSMRRRCAVSVVASGVADRVDVRTSARCVVFDSSELREIWRY
jgi:hypothetical protein